MWAPDKHTGIYVAWRFFLVFFLRKNACAHQLLFDTHTRCPLPFSNPNHVDHLIEFRTWQQCPSTHREVGRAAGRAAANEGGTVTVETATVTRIATVETATVTGITTVTATVTMETGIATATVTFVIIILETRPVTRRNLLTSRMP